MRVADFHRIRKLHTVYFFVVRESDFAVIAVHRYFHFGYEIGVRIHKFVDYLAVGRSEYQMENFFLIDGFLAYELHFIAFLLIIHKAAEWIERA